MKLKKNSCAIIGNCCASFIYQSPAWLCSLDETLATSFIHYKKIKQKKTVTK